MGRNRTRPIAGTSQVDSLPKLLDAVKKAQEELNCQSLWYRGHASIKWQLLPSVIRNVPPQVREYKLWRMERSMFVRFQSGAYSRARDLPDQNDVSKWLCLMRHYGLPTRLLDWTRSPLVAAFFALKQRPIKTPTIWVLNPSRLNNYFKTIAPVLIMRDKTPDKKLRNHFADILRQKDEEKSILAIHPPEVDGRILAQRSTFTIHGIPTPLQNLKLDGSYLYKIRISRNGAQNISRALKLLGYDESVLFPDLDHLASLITTEHSPRRFGLG